ncbi:hypothetical protein TD95_005363 [Thielaviopsis punctulata]|uniref:WLM domain-containing protein n=1 Tax=Thielaviopsis punctulata TaxID=72032 RepID=A0A0F4ZJN6_9PEZI|nr:hypothetical protein TD95_005363 [Thielaviopsis punctulata]
MELKIKYRGTEYVIPGSESSVLADIFEALSKHVDVDPASFKFIIGAKTYTYTRDGSLPFAPFAGKPCRALGVTRDQQHQLSAASQAAAARSAAALSTRRSARGSAPAPLPNPATFNGGFCFKQIQPLTWLPAPGEAHKMLVRLSQDIGILAAMKKFSLSVQLLTEMEPLSNTDVTAEGTGRTLGLNRNNGMVIELRLRTDNHRGFRDYKTVRRTLCHELAHNRVSDHNREFWDFCHAIEKEVDRASSFRTLDGEKGILGDFNAGDDNDGYTGEEEDAGGCVRGTWKLGTGEKQEDVSGLSLRELMARSAMRRQEETKKERERQSDGDDGVAGASRPHE